MKKLITLKTLAAVTACAALLIGVYSVDVKASYFERQSLADAEGEREKKIILGNAAQETNTLEAELEVSHKSNKTLQNRIEDVEHKLLAKDKDNQRLEIQVTTLQQVNSEQSQQLAQLKLQLSQMEGHITPSQYQGTQQDWSDLMKIICSQGNIEAPADAQQMTVADLIRALQANAGRR